MNALILAALLSAGVADDLPAPKVDARPLPVGVDPRRYLRASDYNALRKGMIELEASFVTSIETSPVKATGSTTARQLKDRFSDTVNVKDFGAKGDITTDDTAAIQAAIDRAANGGTVVVPIGSYRVTSTLILRNGVTLQGVASTNKTFGPPPAVTGIPSLLFLDTDAIALIAIDRAVGLQNSAVRDLALSARAVPTTVADSTGKVGLDFTALYPFDLRDVTIERCVFYNFTEAIRVVDPYSGASQPAWAGTTGYGLNAETQNGGNVYRVIQAGTSAGAGGPTGTGANILDGSVRWAYVGAFPVPDWNACPVSLRHVKFLVNGVAILFNTDNADNWIIENSSFLLWDNQVGIDAIRVGLLTLISSGGGGIHSDPTPGTVGVRFRGAARDVIKLIQLHFEAVTNGLSVTSAAAADTLRPIIVESSAIEADMVFAQDVHLISIGNRYGGAGGGGQVYATTEGTIIDSIGDSFLAVNYGFQLSGGASMRTGLSQSPQPGIPAPIIGGRRVFPTASGDRGDTSQTITVGTDAPVQRWATTLTANRTVTLSTTGAANGDTFRVVRTGLGSFTLDVGGLKTIPSATAAFVDVTYDGSAWRLTGYGTL